MSSRFGCALVFVLSACGGGDTNDDGGGTGGASSGGSTAGLPTTGGQSATDGGGGADGSGTGGSATGGTAGGGTGAAAGSGGAGNGECTRALLDGILDDYLAALSAGDPSTLPLSTSLKFTENAQESLIGTTDFWMNAGDVKHSQRALDTVECTVAAQAVIPEGATDLPVGIRIKVEGAEITEVETIVVRQGDYVASFAVDSDPEAIIAVAGDIGWHDEVPLAERATRDELINWVDKYFRLFPSGVCDVSSDCRRLENGGGDFNCGTGATCSPSDPGPSDAVFEPRVLVADVERGIGVGFTMFDFQTTGHVDMHMIKMRGGQVHAVQAILRHTNGESGWD